VKGSIKSDLQQQQANPNAVANLAYNELLYGTESMQAKNVLGTTASVEAMTIEDVKAYYNKNISPSVAVMNVVGALPKGKIMNSLNGLSANWEAKEVTLPETPVAKAPAQSNVYFYDVPNAKQSVLRIGYPALKVSDKDYYPATVMNYKLGGGGFASKLTQELREGKGYTYGIYSEFEGDDRTGNFLVGSGVRSNVTLESTQAIKEIMGNYGKDFTEEDLETTKSFLLKSNARAFETFGAKLGLLENISKNGLSKDYIKKREEIVKNMTAEEIKVLSEKYLDPNKMVWLVVGDKATQFNRMKELGYGNPILLNEPKKVKD
jgi:zinc protease